MLNEVICNMNSVDLLTFILSLMLHISWRMNQSRFSLFTTFSLGTSTHFTCPKASMDCLRYCWVFLKVECLMTVGSSIVYVCHDMNGIEWCIFVYRDSLIITVNYYFQIIILWLMLVLWWLLVLKFWQKLSLVHQMRYSNVIHQEIWTSVSFGINGTSIGSSRESRSLCTSMWLSSLDDVFRRSLLDGSE